MTTQQAARPLSEVLPPSRPRSVGRQPKAPPSDVITPSELAQKLLDLIEELNEAHNEAVQLAHEYADAEHEFELAFCTARLTAETGGGTAGFKDANARQTSAAKKRAATLAQELRRSARDAEENVRCAMSALQTVAKAVSVEIELAGRTGSP